MDSQPPSANVPGSLDEAFYDLLKPSTVADRPKSTDTGSSALYSSIEPSFDFQSRSSLPVTKSEDVQLSSWGHDQDRSEQKVSSSSLLSSVPKGQDMSVSRQSPDSLSLSAVEQTVKKYSDSVMRTLEGVASKIQHLETVTTRLEKAVHDVQQSSANNHGDVDGRLRGLENMIREVHRSVQGIRDRQEIAETQAELAKLRVAPPPTPAPPVPSPAKEPESLALVPAPVPPPAAPFPQQAVQAAAPPPPPPPPPPPSEPITTPPSALYHAHPTAPSAPPSSASYGGQPSQVAPPAVGPPAVPQWQQGHATQGQEQAPPPQKPQPYPQQYPQEYQAHAPQQQQQQQQQQQRYPVQSESQQPQPPPPQQLQQQRYSVQSGAPPQYPSLPSQQQSQQQFAPPQLSQQYTVPPQHEAPPPPVYLPSYANVPPQQTYPVLAPLQSSAPPSTVYESMNYPPRSEYSQSSQPSRQLYDSSSISRPASPGPYGRSQSYKVAQPVASAPSSSGAGYPRLQVAKPVSSSGPPARTVSQGGSGSRSSVSMPLDKVVQELQSMGYSEGAVRNAVRKVQESGQAMDLNAVLDKLNGDNGWRGR